eukprot:g3084.t1
MDELRFKARYDIVMIDNELLSPGCKNATTGAVNWTKCNDFKAARAADIKAVDPSKPTFVYRGGPFGCFSMTDASADPNEQWYNYLDGKTYTLADTWLKDLSGGLVPATCDFRKRPAQDWWLTQMLWGPQKRWLRDTNVDGFFSDSGLIMGFRGDKLNITVGTQRELFNATAALMRRAAEGLQANGKILTFSLKDHFSTIPRTGGGTSGGTLCDPAVPADRPVSEGGVGCFPYGEEVLFDIMDGVQWMPFREYNIPSRDFGDANLTAQWDGCAAAIEDHALESRRLPTVTCNNDGAMNTTLYPTPFGNLSKQGQHQISLAAHLMGMEEGSYFGSGLSWDDDGWHVWWPEYDRPLGRPMGPYQRDPTNTYRFRRSFEYLDVEADCQTLEANFRWRTKPSGWTHTSFNLTTALGARVAAPLGPSSVAFIGGGDADKATVGTTTIVDFAKSKIYTAEDAPHPHAGSSTLGGLLQGPGAAGLAFAAGNDQGIVDLLNPNTHQWLSPLQTARVHAFSACAATGSTLACAGGQGLINKHDHEIPFGVDIFQMDANGSLAKHDSSHRLSVGRKKLSAAAAGDFIAFGLGFSDENTRGYSNAFDLYNVKTGKWSSGHLQEVDVYDTRNDVWSLAANLSVPRGWVSGAGADRCAAFGGGSTVDVFCIGGNAEDKKTGDDKKASVPSCESELDWVFKTNESYGYR